MTHPTGSRHTGGHRSTTGCWTCKVRKKKCDEKRPLCDECDALHITCHYGYEKPDWFDGGVQQQAMAEQIKREVKEHAPYRRIDHSEDVSRARDSTEIPEVTMSLYDAHTDLVHEGVNGGIPCAYDLGKTPFEPSDSALVAFYLEHVFAFLYPFYRPCPLHGGKAWILELILTRPVVRQAVLCQSSYYLSLARRSEDGHALWASVLTKTKDLFETLRKALSIIDNFGVADHVQGSVRILTGIMQIQRFEIAISSFENCQAHLNAAVHIFQELYRTVDAEGEVRSDWGFQAIHATLAKPSETQYARGDQDLSSEQSAFQFSSSLLLFDDIIASTVLQDQPRLQPFHQALLGGSDACKPCLDLEQVVGCQNAVLIQIAEISSLAAWKQRCKVSGSLDVMELVHRAGPIKASLEALVKNLAAEPMRNIEGQDSFLDLFTAADNNQPSQRRGQTISASQIWAHAALLYLHVVVSGWQPSHPDVQHHVTQVIRLVTTQLSPPTLLATMVWPFCVAGCLAEVSSEKHFRFLVEFFRPASVMRTLRKAFEIMEDAWRHRDADDAASRDFASRFKIEDELILLV